MHAGTLRQVLLLPSTSLPLASVASMNKTFDLAAMMVWMVYLVGHLSAGANLFGAGAITIQPPTVSLKPGDWVTFRAEGVDPDRAVVWAVQEPHAGYFGGSALGTSVSYCAPIRSGTFHVVASDLMDPAIRAEATVVIAPMTIRVQPATATLATGGWLELSAECTNVKTGVDWSVLEEEGGSAFDAPEDPNSLCAKGRYRAPLKAGTYHVLAKILSSNPPVRGTATVTVVVPRITIVPSSTTLEVNGRRDFQATLSDGGEASLISWELQEANGGYVAPGLGSYWAPSEPGIYHLVAQIKVSDPPSDPAFATIMVKKKNAHGEDEEDSRASTGDDPTHRHTLPKSNRLAIEVLRPLADTMQDKPGEILVLIWDWKGGGVFGKQPSVGHAASAVWNDGQWTIIHSQFPHEASGKSQIFGSNNTISDPGDLFMAEGGRKPNSAFLVSLPDLGGFAKYMITDLEKLFWEPDPGRPWNATNCTYGNIHGLRAGGVPLSSMWANQTLIIPLLPYLPRDLRTALKRDSLLNESHAYKVFRKDELIDALPWEANND